MDLAPKGASQARDRHHGRPMGWHHMPMQSKPKARAARACCGSCVANDRSTPRRSLSNRALARWMVSSHLHHRCHGQSGSLQDRAGQGHGCNPTLDPAQLLSRVGDALIVERSLESEAIDHAAGLHVDEFTRVREVPLGSDIQWFRLAQEDPEDRAGVEIDRHR